MLQDSRHSACTRLSPVSQRPRDYFLLRFTSVDTSKHPTSITSTSVGTDLYPHMPTLLRAIYCNGMRGPRAGRFVRFWASRRAKFPKMCDSLPWTPTNRSAKFDAVSFILGGEIRNRTNKHTKTVTDILHTLPVGMCR